jgi:hypothetical protein
VSTARLRSLSDLLRNSEIQITDDLHLAALADDEYEPVMLFVNHSWQHPDLQRKYRGYFSWYLQRRIQDQ